VHEGSTVRLKPDTTEATSG